MFDEKSDRATVQDGTAIDAQPKAKQVEVMGLAEGVPATDWDRPLLRRPAPEFMSGREMLDVVWRKSPWAPDDDAFDYGLAYAVNSDLEMREFKRYATGVLKLGFLPSSAKFGDGLFRDVVSYRSESPAIFIALMNGSPIEANVRRVVTDQMAFYPGKRAAARGRISCTGSRSNRACRDRATRRPDRTHADPHTACGGSIPRRGRDRRR